MSELIQLMVESEEWTLDEASEWLKDARKQVRAGVDPEELLYEIGYEPDFIWELI